LSARQARNDIAAADLGVFNRGRAPNRGLAGVALRNAQNRASAGKRRAAKRKAMSAAGFMSSGGRRSAGAGTRSG